MQTGRQAEALLCPNCKEEVPKTLYCLNCGYPLYKIEVESEPVVEDTPEPVVTVEPEIIQEEIVEIMPEPPAPVMEEYVEIVPEPIVEAPIEEDVYVFVDPVEQPEAIEPEVEDIIDHEPVVEPMVEEAPKPVIELVVEEVIEFEPVVEPVVEVVPEAPVEEEVMIAEEPEVEAEPEVVAVPEYEPDPVIKEVMGNLAKNISMKIKLVDLLRTGGVKSEIFGKLFDSYMARGELLMNSRSEMLERVRYDLGSMEGALHEAKEGLEELDIRQAIEDVSEEEYAAKAPGFQWDIGQYKDEVGKKQAEIYYLEDIKRVMSSDGIVELIGLGEGCSEDLDELIESEGIDGDTAARIRVSLEEALACIR